MNRTNSPWWPILLALGWLLGPLPATGHAQLGPSAAADDAPKAELLFATGDPQAFVPAPTLHTDVFLSVTGPIVRAQVTQQFQNPTDQWLEGVYVFPLPATAAVDHLQMMVGDRIIHGQILERQEARQLYQQAKYSGTKASLIEQGRPNIFTTRVANIGPGESIQVVIEYQDVVQYDSGEFRLRFPLVVAPRYTPPPAGEQMQPDDGSLSPDEPGDEPPADEAGPDAPRGEGLDPVTLTVELNPGLPLKWLYSPSHNIETEPLQDQSWVVRLTGDVVADRDFVLVWAPDIGDNPRTIVFTEPWDGDTYALLMVVPPDPQLPSRRLPRESIFVIDTSGSMNGASLQQAKLALLIALDKLEPEDRFNVIQFNSVTSQLFPTSAAADAEDVEAARQYVDSLRADGGTEMRSALAAALAGDAGLDRVRQVVFVTDGEVGNEMQLFGDISRNLGRTRLFTVGIGSAPNAYFMRKAAQFGRGTFTYIGSPDEVSERMDALFHKIERPVLSNVEVDWSDPGADAEPAQVPDLYAGEPLVVTARLSSADGEVFLGGTRPDQDWQVDVPLAPDTVAEQSTPDLGIAKLWARRKIAGLMDSLVEGADPQAMRAAVVDLGLRHHLVTRYTSLVAVDVTPTAPAQSEALTRRIPLNAPSGYVGHLPQTATAAPLYGMVALVLATLALLLKGSEILSAASGMTFPHPDLPGGEGTQIRRGALFPARGTRCNRAD